jgi:LPXTG-motif cell wall-anchored protein
MYSTSSRVPAARRSAAAVGAAVALAAGTLALGPASLAHAAPAKSGPGGGTADAVILRTGLDVSLLNKQADVPLSVVLNEVHAPANAHKTLLTAKLDGVDAGRPVNILRADVANTKATADADKSEGYANLANATVHLPGLPLTSLIKVDAVTSKATCEKGKAPTAGTNFVGDVTVLGKKVAVRAGGTTTVKVDGVGEVGLEMAKTVKTSSSAASTALQLQVHIKPANLNVSEITGDVTLVKAACQLPGDGGGSSTSGSTSGGDGGTSGGDGSSSSGSSSGSSGGASEGSSGGSSGGASDGSSSGGADSSGATNGTSGSGNSSGNGAEPNGKSGNLAETGGSSATPYIAGAAAVLVVAGGGAVYLTRRRKSGAS